MKWTTISSIAAVFALASVANAQCYTYSGGCGYSGSCGSSLWDGFCGGCGTSMGCGWGLGGCGRCSSSFGMLRPCGWNWHGSEIGQCGGCGLGGGLVRLVGCGGWGLGRCRSGCGFSLGCGDLLGRFRGLFRRCHTHVCGIDCDHDCGFGEMGCTSCGGHVVSGSPIIEGTPIESGTIIQPSPAPVPATPSPAAPAKPEPPSAWKLRAPEILNSIDVKPINDRSVRRLPRTTYMSF